MNGMKPKFLEEGVLPKDYYENPKPYASPAQTKLNLLELSRYAELNGKKVADLTQEEIEKFRI